jgi:hypothetical protein
MLFSVILPAYNAAHHIGKALRSIHAGFDAPLGWQLEVIVVNDGSSDGAALAQACAAWPAVRIIDHGSNRGMCAARNSGFAVSQGDYVTLLDADDEFIDHWFTVFQTLLAEWPATAQVCFTPCVNDAGEQTCAAPGYRGWLTAEDMAVDRWSGEYNPIFRGEYIRHTGYADLGTRKSCGLLTYLRMSREAPFWITDKVQRIYHDAVEQSVTSGWTKPDKAAETCQCFSTVLVEHGTFIRGVSEKKYRQMVCKTLIYRMLALQGRDFKTLLTAFSWQGLLPWLATFGLLLLGPAATVTLLGAAKKWRILRRYG